MPGTDKATQTSAIFGVAVFGKTVFGVVLSQIGGLPSAEEGGTERQSPWRRLPVATTTWTRV